MDAEKKKKKKKKKKKRAASGCWHYIKSRANIKWTLEKIWAAGACQRPDIYTGDRRFSGNLWKSATSSPPELKEIETWQTAHFEDK